MNQSNHQTQAEPTLATCPETGDPESRLRAYWTAKGIPEHRQTEIIAALAAKAQPGTQIGPFRVPSHPP